MVFSSSSTLSISLFTCSVALQILKLPQPKATFWQLQDNWYLWCYLGFGLLFWVLAGLFLLLLFILGWLDDWLVFSNIKLDYLSKNTFYEPGK